MIPEKFLSKEFLTLSSNLDFGFYEVTKDKIIGYIAYDDGRKQVMEWYRSCLSDYRGLNDLKLNLPAVTDYIFHSNEPKSSKIEMFNFVVSYYEEQVEVNRGE